MLGRAPPEPFEPPSVFRYARAFLRLSRLKFLVGGFVGGGFGTVLAVYERGGLDWKAYALAQATISSFHLMTHYSNDYFDRASDARTIRTPYSGGSGALVDGSLAPVIGLRAALVCAAAGTLGTIVLATSLEPASAAFAVSIGVLAWSYSAPPLRLLARGLGEFDTALIVGALVPLCAYAAQAGWPTARALTSTLPAAAAMLAMMVAVEYPDLAADGATGKRNLVVRLGPRRAKPLGVAAAASVYIGVAIARSCGAPAQFVACEALSLPFAVAFAFAVVRYRALQPRAGAALAARGVALFLTVAALGLVAYAVAPPLPAHAAPHAETKAMRAAVARV